jgi:tRNA nucleotidyltransferase (CCA-adding enzyme)
MKPKYYIVGGYVRDLFLNVKSKDVDFCCECDSYAEMRADLISKGVEIFLENEKFLTIRARHPKFGGVDYVCCREEAGYADGRRPDEVRIGTLLSDLSRRDATCNAIAMTEDGEFIDPFNGIEDIKKNLYRCV